MSKPKSMVPPLYAGVLRRPPAQSLSQAMHRETWLQPLALANMDICGMKQAVVGRSKSLRLPLPVSPHRTAEHRVALIPLFTSCLTTQLSSTEAVAPTHFMIVIKQGGENPTNKTS